MKQLYNTKKLHNGQIMVIYYPKSEGEKIKIYANYNNYVYDVTSKNQNQVLGEQLYYENGLPLYVGLDSFENVLKSHLKRWARCERNFYERNRFYRSV